MEESDLEQKDEKNVQKTKDQHYVPQFYLKKFVNNENKLEILDCERRKVVAPRTPKAVCNDEYFYSVDGKEDDASQVIENDLRDLEDSIAKVYDEIAVKILDSKKLTDNEKWIISSFMSMLYLRGPYMRKQISSGETKLMKDIMKLRASEIKDETWKQIERESGKVIPLSEREKVIEAFKKGEYELETNNATHLSLLGEIHGFANLFFAKEWKVFVSKSSKKFITSDNPVVELFPEWTGKIAYGPTFFQRTHIFSMTPDIHIIATDPRNPPKIGDIQRKTLFDNPKDNDVVLEHNFDFPRHAIAYAYAKDKDSLQAIADSANLYDKQRMRRLRGL